MSAAAARALLDATTQAGGDAIRLTINERFEHDLTCSAPSALDEVVTTGGLTLLLDPESAPRADGVSIDYVDGPQGPGFSIDNPHQPPRVRQLSALEFKDMRDRGVSLELVDVRTDEERAIATIDGSRLLDSVYHKYLLGLDRGATLVFQCHHGIRSQAAAEYFLQAGFKNLYNLRGGIDAWSQLVDPTIVRY